VEWALGTQPLDAKIVPSVHDLPALANRFIPCTMGGLEAFDQIPNHQRPVNTPLTAAQTSWPQTHARPLLFPPRAVPSPPPQRPAAQPVAGMVPRIQPPRNSQPSPRARHSSGVAPVTRFITNAQQTPQYYNQYAGNRYHLSATPSAPLPHKPQPVCAEQLQPGLPLAPSGWRSQMRMP
jgi:hypothetical protein